MAGTHFASGQVSSTKTDVYTAPSTPSGAVFEIGRVVLTNTTSNKQEIDIYRNDGTEYLLEKVILPAGIGKSYIVNALNGAKLISTYTIAMQATNNNEVNYQIDGKTTT